MANYNSQRKRTGNLPITTLPPTDLQRRIVNIFGKEGLGQEMIPEAGFSSIFLIKFYLGK